MDVKKIYYRLGKTAVGEKTQETRGFGETFINAINKISLSFLFLP